MASTTLLCRGRKASAIFARVVAMVGLASFLLLRADAAITAGCKITFSATADGTPAPTFQWKKDGVALPDATGATFIIASATPADAGAYRVTASNVAGSADSADEIVAVEPGTDPIGVAPAFTLQPIASQTVTVGSSVSFTVAVTGSPTPTLQWKKGGTVISGATNATLTLASVTTNDAATYSAVATNPVGSVTSQNAFLVVGNSPTITSQPISQTVAAKATVTFTVAVTGSPIPSLQWKKNGLKIKGAIGITLTLARVGSTDEGSYTVDVINSFGSVTSTPARLTLAPIRGKQLADGELSAGSTTVDPTAIDSRIVNLSVRARAGSGDNGLIVGFVVSGASTKPMLLRGVGPALSDFGVSDVLIDPTLALFSGDALTASNDDWAQSATAPQIAETSARLGAFTLPDTGADSALLVELENGAYTMQVNGKSATTGVALVEVYDAAASNPATLVNLSVRTLVGTGDDVPNVGFVVSGTTAKRVMIRAVGPTLAAFGVADVLADPQLEIFQDGLSLDANDDWGGDVELAATFARIGAFGLGHAYSKDAVLFITLQPGAYTVVASGVDGSTGVALVEVYDVP